MASDGISTDEFAQYDRQIRLWGLDAQKRLRQADVLVAGLGGLGSEVVKNIVLAGVHSVTLLDPSSVCKDDLCSQLLINPSDLGRNIAEASVKRTHQLNPNVLVLSDDGNLDEKSEDYFEKFDVVCITRCTEVIRKKLNLICRKKSINFFCGDVFGCFGYFFTDLQVHEFAMEVPVKSTSSADGEPHAKKLKSSNEAMSVSVMRTSEFCSYDDAMAEDWSKRSRKEIKNSSQVFFILKTIDQFASEYNRLPQPSDRNTLKSMNAKLLTQHGVKASFIDENFSNCCFSVLSPVAAIVGGVLSQEIIKSISKKDVPHNNFFFYDGLKHVGTVDHICPKSVI